MQCPHMCVCVCVCPEPGSLLLEGSDQREVTREISPMYESEKEW